MADLKILHVVRAIHAIVHHTPPSAAKSLDSVNLAFLVEGRFGDNLQS